MGKNPEMVGPVQGPIHILSAYSSERHKKGLRGVVGRLSGGGQFRQNQNNELNNESLNKQPI